MDENGKLIVMGASAGGIEAFLQLAPRLDPEMPAAVCLVQHISEKAPTMFAEYLSRTAPFPASFAGDGEPVMTGRIFLAPPDRHMVVSDGKLRLIRGPRENWSRPAIDPLFRSAAAYYGSRTIGVLLTGTLDDGTEGLLAIKRCGGTTIVQDPAEAAFPDMPRSAIASGSVDHITPLASIPRLLSSLAAAPARKGQPPPEDIAREVAFLERGEVAFDYGGQAYHPSPLACPECGGPLWEKNGEGTGPYGCTVGHRYGALSLVAVQDAAVEQSLWAALRMLQERARVLKRLAGDEKRGGRERLAKIYLERAEESEMHAEHLKEFLQHVPRGVDTGAVAG